MHKAPAVTSEQLFCRQLGTTAVPAYLLHLLLLDIQQTLLSVAQYACWLQAALHAAGFPAAAAKLVATALAQGWTELYYTWAAALEHCF